MQKSKTRKILNTFFAIAMCSLLFVACGAALEEEQKDDVLVQSITVKAPTKKNYTTGEQLNFAGMVITVNWDDGTTTIINAPSDGSKPDDVIVTGFNPGTAGTQVVTVTYWGRSDTFTVNVTGVTKTVKSIAVATKPTKSEYVVGESINYAGMKITVTWSDDTTSTINATTSSLPADVTSSGFSSTTAGEKTVTVTYSGKTATFTVTVNAAVVKTVAGISVTTVPTKTTYSIGDTINYIDMVITAT